MQLSKVFLILFCCIPVFRSYGQVDTIPLKKAISELEKKHEISFNYTEEYLDNDVFYNSEDSLEETLFSLEKQTNLRFEILEVSKKVIVRPFRKDDIISICANVIENDFPGVNIEIQSVLEPNKKVLTNEDGFFKLNNLNFNDHILLRKEEVFLKKIAVSELYGDSCPQIEVIIYQELLDEVKIANYLAKGISKNEQKITLRPNDFEVLAGNIEPDIFKNLEHIPGVQSPFEAISNVFVRGGTPDQNLVLWNGIKTYNQSHFYGMLSAFNPYVIEQVDFYNKGVNAKYGDRLSSVIDIQSSKKIVDSFAAGVGTNLLYADGFFKMPLVKNKLSIEASIRRSFTDIWKSPSYTPMAKRVFQNTSLDESFSNGNDTFYFFDYNFGLHGQITKKDHIQLNGIYAVNDLDFQSGSTTNNFSETQKTENEGYSFQWRHKYSNTISQHSKANIANYTLVANNAVSDNVTGDENSEVQKNYIQDYGGKSYFDIKFSKNNSIQLGGEFSQNKIRYAIEDKTSNFSLILDEESNILKTYSVFGEFKLSKSKSYIFNLGGRINKYSTHSSYFIEPRFYGEYYIFPKFSLNGAASYTTQAITQIQTSLTTISTLGNFLWRITDGNFNVLKASQVSFGGTYQNKSWFIELDSYLKYIDNITSLTAGFLNPVDDNEFNTGDNRTYGLEFFIKKKFRNYSTWISYAYSNQETKFDAVNNGEYFTSNLNIEHTFKWLHFYRLKSFQFSLSWFWHSGRSITDVSSIKEEGKPVALFYDELNGNQLPVYHKLDASVLYNFKAFGAEKCQLGLSAQNIYNQQTVLNREFKTTPGIDNELFVLDYYSMSFTPNLSFRLFW